MEVRELKKKEFKTMDLAKKEEMVKKMRKEYDKLVKGMFEFTDAQGGWIDFSYRFFPGEPLQVYHFVHGEICEIPMGIVKHLNNTYKKIRTLSKMQGGDETSRGPAAFTMTKTSRVRFVPVDAL